MPTAAAEVRQPADGVPEARLEPRRLPRAGRLRARPRDRAAAERAGRAGLVPPAH